ncbi:myoD family inhibitor domain-containing protein 2 isoform 2-T2 [Anomaloglossus baeobatrachus]
MSEDNKTKKSLEIFQNEQETIAWLAGEQSIASGSREDRPKTKEKLSPKHKPPPSPDTGDESFQESNHPRKQLVTYSSNEECSKSLSYKEAKQITPHQTNNEGVSSPLPYSGLVLSGIVAYGNDKTFRCHDVGGQLMAWQCLISTEDIPDCIKVGRGPVAPRRGLGTSRRGQEDAAINCTEEHVGIGERITSITPTASDVLAHWEMLGNFRRSGKDQKM